MEKLGDSGGARGTLSLLVLGAVGPSPDPVAQPGAGGTAHMAWLHPSWVSTSHFTSGISVSSSGDGGGLGTAEPAK